mmetsp:Transcript_14211/g.30836  ORF Transcript_14211/g.30836 Transcript_14211/m.30836 type:complete len:200 (-) Transcript_14211:2016-2615(-)
MMFSGGMPMSLAITEAVRMLSPVSMYVLIFIASCRTFTVRAAESFSLSIIPITHSVRPFNDTAIAVCPLLSRNSMASYVPGLASILLVNRHLRLPIWMAFPPTVQLTPVPVSAEKSSTCINGRSSPSPMPYSAALARMALARGCSLPFSAQAAKKRMFSRVLLLTALVVVPLFSVRSSLIVLQHEEEVGDDKWLFIVLS